MVSICRSKTKYQIVLTKTDVVFPIDVARRAMQIEEVNIGHPNEPFVWKLYSILEINKFLYVWSQSLLQNKSVVKPLVYRFFLLICSFHTILFPLFLPLLLGLSFGFCIVSIADDGKLKNWSRNPKLENSSSQYNSICQKIIVRWSYFVSFCFLF